MNSAAKVIQFPLAGIAKDQDYRKAYIPSEGVAFATPFAVNVLGNCTFSDRKRGGSRPGLKAYTGTNEETTGIWMWPNGDYIDWSDATASDTSRVLFSTDNVIVTPSGELLFDQHATFNVQAAKGSVPSDVSIMVKYRGRLVIAKNDMWYASRQGDITDFDYGGDGEDEGRACAGNAALADLKGENITAMAAIEDKYLIVATKRSIRVLSGEPTTGEWATASEFTGITSANAWCWDSGTFWFIGMSGLYAMVPGENVIKKASGRLPLDFKGTAENILVYDSERNGIHLLIQQYTVHYFWFYDIEQGAFWRIEYNDGYNPTKACICTVDLVDKVLFYTSNGWCYWDDATTKDFGEITIASKVAVGPFRASLRDDMDGMLAELTATMGEGSADVTVEVYTASSPEKAVYHAEVGQSPKATFTVGEGWNHVWRPRTRGAWVIFVLKSNGRWAYESMTAVCKMLGRLR